VLTGAQPTAKRRCDGDKERQGLELNAEAEEGARKRGREGEPVQ
jgi:hypothetical protein